ncbi:glycine oxidase ThiO [Hydrogenovibrio halophilus]|uniref:glycine oxidase ThiO n=1 Tax=Hydrogenovibrio halophilus TaxID=373391 RepID=UPI00035D76CA|nr:glycine oxidase ThiO [Hydrogenovibrio halophilus]
MAERRHFGIVGAGLLGRILAMTLIGHGHRVTLFDRDASFGDQSAGMTAAGMLAPFAEVETAESDILTLGLRSMALWPELVRTLGIETALQQQGSVLTAHPADQNELALFMQRLKSRAPEASQTVQPLESAQLQQLEPDLSAFHQAWYLPQEGQVDSRRFMAASERFLHQHPLVDWQITSSADPTREGTVRTEEASPQGFDHVFDCRGLGAAPDWQSLRGVRGEVIRIQAPEVRLQRPVRLMHPRYRIYVVPRPHNEYVIGATEIEANDDSPLSVRSALELLSAAYSLHPGFGEARILETRTACRPALPDNKPSMVQEGKRTRINGLYRHGYLLAPALAQDAAACFVPAFVADDNLTKTEDPA